MSELENQVSAGDTTASAGWKGQHVYLMAIACLALGVAIGYFLRGSQSPAETAAVPAASAPAMPAQTASATQPPTLERMKAMADKAAAPALEKIKQNPKDFNALNDAGKVYRATHQFQLAASYYEKALEINPKDPAVRTDLASCLFYIGDVDGALAQLDKALSYDPKFFGALLNSGVIKLQGKDDVNGAIASWEKILKVDTDPKHQEIAKKLIADAKQKSAEQTSFPKS